MKAAAKVLNLGLSHSPKHLDSPKHSDTVFVCYNTTSGANSSKIGRYLGKQRPKSRSKIGPAWMLFGTRKTLKIFIFTTTNAYL